MKIFKNELSLILHVNKLPKTVQHMKALRMRANTQCSVNDPSSLHPWKTAGAFSTGDQS